MKEGRKELITSARLKAELFYGIKRDQERFLKQKQELLVPA